MATARRRRSRDRSPVTDRTQMHDIESIEDGQVHDVTGGLMQVPEERHGCAMQPILMYRKVTQLGQPKSEFVVAPASPQPAELDQMLEDAMDGCPGEACTPDDLGEVLPAGPVKRAEHQRCPPENGTGRAVFDLDAHVCCSRNCDVLLSSDASLEQTAVYRQSN